MLTPSLIFERRTNNDLRLCLNIQILPELDNNINLIAEFSRVVRMFVTRAASTSRMAPEKKI